MSGWLSGLKYAEEAAARLGAEKAEEVCTAQAYGSSDDFDKGINSYFFHLSKLKEKNIEPVFI